jgi:uncharacterized membrane protein (UPF0136 family)
MSVGNRILCYTLFIIAMMYLMRSAHWPLLLALALTVVVVPEGVLRLRRTR